MKTPAIIGASAATLLLLAMQACSSDETPAGSTSSGSDTSSSSTSSTSASSTSSGSTSGSTSGSNGTDTCTPAGGSCVCGSLTTDCPHGGTRDGAYKCPQGPQGSGACFTTCCVGGDAAAPPVDSGVDSGQDSGASDADTDGG